MSVPDNLAAGSLFAGRAASHAQAQNEAMEHLRFGGPEAMADNPASTLTLPSHKRLELAKSLAMRPRLLLLLDEVNAGLNSAEIGKAVDLIRAIAARWVTILLIEHPMKVVFSLYDELMVLHHGELIAHSKPQGVTSDAKVIEAYLGTKFAQRMNA